MPKVEKQKVEKQTFTFEAWPVGTVLHIPKSDKFEKVWHVETIAVWDFLYGSNGLDAYCYIAPRGGQDYVEFAAADVCFLTTAEAQSECDKRNGGGK